MDASVATIVNLPSGYKGNGNGNARNPHSVLLMHSLTYWMIKCLTQHSANTGHADNR